LTSPADNTTTPLKHVVLQWKPVAGASKYQVQVSPNAEWTNNTVTLADDGKTPNDLFEMPMSLPHASYFWRVRAKVGSSWSDYATPREFLREWEAPFTILHAPDSTDATVAWTPVNDASLYVVRFGTAPDFNTTGDNTTFTCFTNQTSFSPYDVTGPDENSSGDCFGPEALTSGTAYYWQVIPYDDSTAPPVVADTGATSPYLCEQAQPECDADYVTSDSPFTYTAPEAGTVTATTVSGLKTSWHSTSASETSCDSATKCPITPTFSWDPVTGANLYHVQVFLDPDATNTFRAYDTQSTQLTPRDSFFDGQSGKTYYWIVTAGTCTTDTAAICDADNADGTQSLTAFSTLHTFSKQSGTVSLTSPADAAVVHGRNVTFNWSDFLATGGRGSYDARNYRLEVSSSPTFSATVIDQSDIDLTQYTDTTNALGDGTYYWRVAAIDESGNLLTWSEPRTVTVNAKSPKISISSDDGVAIKGPLAIQLTHGVHGVSTKTVKVVPVDGAARPVAGKLRLGASPTSFSFIPKHPLVTGATYNLRVSRSLVDANGNRVMVKGNGVRTKTVAKNRSAGWSYSNGWQHHHASGARSGSFVSAGHGATATLQVAGSKATLYGCTGPNMGKIAVSVGSHRQVVDEHQSFTRCGVAVWQGALKRSGQRLRVTVAGGTGSIDEVRIK
jgi:hypothetical protein